MFSITVNKHFIPTAIKEDLYENYCRVTNLLAFISVHTASGYRPENYGGFLYAHVAQDHGDLVQDIGNAGMFYLEKLYKLGEMCPEPCGMFVVFRMHDMMFKIIDKLVYPLSFFLLGNIQRISLIPKLLY